ncbi:ergothioneine biosynthesis protein EgtC [Tsukamurella soli]|uniref:Gamma-glutamyl-hercynylcysteine sulfoxide hydrolase n=1 Tax=Tsukamurella soli TaxID=644556 RepID=A0ABP8J244_9ACTN
MCRHLAYVGPAVPVAHPVTGGEHSLRTQAWAPRDMRGGGTINADGFGVAWWPDPGGARGGESPGASSTAVRYRNPAPIWTDPAVDEVLPLLTARAVLAAVRSATVGTPVAREACAPFTHGRFAFSHNGVVPDWAELLTPAAADLEALTDSAALWARLLAALPGSDPADALATLVRDVTEQRPGARITTLLCDGESAWGTTYYHSLWFRDTGDSAWLASEPVDDTDDWHQIPDHSIVVARPGRVTVAPL